jgi:hypothetical protein
MAVCGRCLICGHKFAGGDEPGELGPDEAVRWACKSEHCSEHREHSQRAWGEVYEHAICTGCHDVLVGAGEHTLGDAVRDLLLLVQRRTEST